MNNNLQSRSNKQCWPNINPIKLCWLVEISKMTLYKIGCIKYLPFVAERRKNMNIFPFQRILLNIVRLKFIQYIFPDILYRTMGKCFPNVAIKTAKNVYFHIRFTHSFWNHPLTFKLLSIIYQDIFYQHSNNVVPRPQH